jgi:serine/threonine-protein kinase PknK
LSARAAVGPSAAPRRGRSNGGIARQLWVTEGTVEKHVQHILTKLGLPETDDDHRRVLAVITLLESRWKAP